MEGNKGEGGGSLGDKKRLGRKGREG